MAWSGLIGPVVTARGRQAVAAAVMVTRKGTDMSTETILENVVPSRADLERLCHGASGVVLRSCTLDGLDLSRLDLSDWRFEKCTLSRARFTGARLEDVTFANCRAAAVSFAGASLSDTTVAGGDFGNADFLGARLSGVRFERCKMTGANLTEVAALDVTFEEVLLVLALLPKFSFRKAALQGVDFSEADLRQCDFRDAVLSDCSLRNANITDCRFQGTDLRGADLGGVKLTDAPKFKGAVISRRQAGELLGQLGLKVM